VKDPEAARFAIARAKLTEREIIAPVRQSVNVLQKNLAMLALDAKGYEQQLRTQVSPDGKNLGEFLKSMAKDAQGGRRTRGKKRTKSRKKRRKSRRKSKGRKRRRKNLKKRTKRRI
jgi:hypothetical protein